MCFSRNHDIVHYDYKQGVFMMKFPLIYEYICFHSHPNMVLLRTVKSLTIFYSKFEEHVLKAHYASAMP
jgi:hypothetical protein